MFDILPASLEIDSISWIDHESLINCLKNAKRTVLKFLSSTFESSMISEASCNRCLTFLCSLNMAGTQVLEIIAVLHSGRHWMSSSAVIAEKGFPILWIGAVGAVDVVDFAVFFFGEKLFKTSMSVAVTVEHVERPGVEHIVEEESLEELRSKFCLDGVTGGSLCGNPWDGSRSEPGNSTGCNLSFGCGVSGIERQTHGDRPVTL